MKVNTSIFTLLLIISEAFLLGLFSVAPFVRSAIPNHPLLGIPPQDEDYYKISSSDTIKCKDGSKKFTKAQLNDDFCDCPDATDEPGTSACPGGKFYCRNAGHTPVMIFSSRVNDGICDCCDGSDEYDGQVKCPNTCWEAGKVARDKLRKKIATYKEGVALRKQEIEQAKLAVTKDEVELLKLKDEEKILKGLVQQLKEHKEQIEKAEEKERLQKEKEEKERKEAEEKANKQNTEVEDESKQEKGLTDDNTESQDETVESMDNDKIGVLDDSSQHQDMTMERVDPVADTGVDSSKLEGSTITGEEQHASEENDSVSPKSEDDSVVASETGDDAGSEVSHGQASKVEGDISESTEGLSKEELGRLVASRWIGNTEESEGLSSAKEMDHEDHGDMPQDTHDEEYDGYASETEDETGKYDDVDVEDDADESYDIHDDAASSYKPASDDDFDLPDATSPSNPSWLEKIQQTVRSILKAINLFQTPVDITDAARVRKEYEESSTKLSKLQSRISSLTQKLNHDFGKDKEFYSFYNRCFESKQNKYVYKVCPFKQASQLEGHATTCLGRWDKFEDSYRIMIFSSGDRCWNGPDRSMKVKLRCGLTNEVTDVDEPSRCEYVALLSTPALCLEEKLQELEDKLDGMNGEQPQGHDEL